MLIVPGHSYLLVSSVEPQWDAVDPIDYLSCSGENVAVEELRHLMLQARQHPLGSLRLLVIKQAHQLSEVAQNILLKLLEEPPTQAAVVLQTLHKDRLLPTVLSRLHILKIDEDKINTTAPSAITDDLEAKITQLKDRAQVSQYLTVLLSHYKEEVLARLSPEVVTKLSLLEQTLTRLAHNTNLKLTLDSLLLRWPS